MLSIFLRSFLDLGFLIKATGREKYTWQTISCMVQIEAKNKQNTIAQYMIND